MNGCIDRTLIFPWEFPVGNEGCSSTLQVLFNVPRRTGKTLYKCVSLCVWGGHGGGSGVGLHMHNKVCIPHKDQGQQFAEA